MYFKDHLPLALKPDLTTLDEHLACEIQNGSKRFFLTVLYRSPSQSIEQFSLFRQRWEETIININDCSPTIAIYIGDFNARNSEWWNGDSTNLQGTELAELAAQYSLNQLSPINFCKSDSLLFFLQPTGGESGISEELMSMLSAKLLIVLIGIGRLTA